MSVKAFVQQGWADHATDAEGVYLRFDDGIALASEIGDLGALAMLITHVAGEHLGRWHDGVALLDRLVAHHAFDAAQPVGRAVHRCRAVLYRCAGDDAAEAAFDECRSPDAPVASDRVRMLGTVTSAFAGQRRPADAAATFAEALDLAEGLSNDDPAVRSLAMAGNNLACELEVRQDRGAPEDALLRQAATTARTYWALCGTWENVKIAEYRLCMTMLALGEPGTAVAHAEAAIALCDANDGSAQDRFFPLEALCKAQLARDDRSAATEARDAAARALASLDEPPPWLSAALVELDALLTPSSSGPSPA